MTDPAACRLCAAAFARTATRHEPRPVLWAAPSARVLIAGQAPGLKVHQSGVPFDDRSGDRLRDWLGLDRATFYDRSRLAIVPMALCFPGYDDKGADLPPPRCCAETWRSGILAQLTNLRVTFVIGQYAQRWHLGPQASKGGVTATVARWRDHAPRVFPLPHPSWRNNAFLRRNPWFETDLLPAARAAVRQALAA
ncbi:MAG: uracil-DNA glycosylase family protein [Rhodobacter sp.]|nr:uracil-DNA glycosylase family protein [Paracoccaceae bacterium]MCC0081088.1 uracil-DNA glycosylase family protein [Rhodobacter sp.]